MYVIREKKKRRLIILLLIAGILAIGAVWWCSKNNGERDYRYGSRFLPLKQGWGLSYYTINNKIVPALITPPNADRSVLSLQCKEGNEYYEMHFNGAVIRPNPGDAFILNPNGQDFVGILGNLGYEECGSDEKLKNDVLELLTKCGIAYP